MTDEEAIALARSRWGSAAVVVKSTIGASTGWVHTYEVGRERGDSVRVSPPSPTWELAFERAGAVDG